LKLSCSSIIISIAKIRITQRLPPHLPEPLNNGLKNPIIKERSPNHPKHISQQIHPNPLPPIHIAIKNSTKQINSNGDGKIYHKRFCLGAQFDRKVKEKSDRQKATDLVFDECRIRVGYLKNEEYHNECAHHLASNLAQYANSVGLKWCDWLQPHILSWLVQVVYVACDK
jgi:hypothetical protein